MYSTFLKWKVDGHMARLQHLDRKELVFHGCPMPLERMIPCNWRTDHILDPKFRYAFERDRLSYNPGREK